MRVTFYGHFTGWSSYPSVCRGIARWLRKQKGVRLRLCDLRAEGLYQDVGGIERVSENERAAILSKAMDVGRGGMPSTVRLSGVGLVFAFPTWLPALPRHDHMVGYHVSDVDVVPDGWVEAIDSRIDHLCAPSEWSRQAFVRSGVETCTSVLQHGVAEVFRVKPDRRPDSILVRHFFSQGGMQRKGTTELLRVLDGAELKRWGARLDLHGDLQGSPSGWQGRGVVHVHPEKAGPPSRMAIRLQASSLIVQPSRAEGFGLVPLEALACGTPVVATSCSGHAEYLDDETPGAMIIPFDSMATCGTGLGVGRAPSVAPADIIRSLRTAMHHLAELTEAAQDNADTIRNAWSWDATLSRGRLLDILTA